MVGVIGGIGISVFGMYFNFIIINSSFFNVMDEVQDFSLAGNILSLIQDVILVDLSVYLDNIDIQDLFIFGNDLSLIDGGIVIIDGDVNNEVQMILIGVVMGIVVVSFLDVDVIDGGIVSFIEGDGIQIIFNGSNGVNIINIEFVVVEVDDYVDVGVQGVVIGEYFYILVGNIMGLLAGIKVCCVFQYKNIF